MVQRMREKDEAADGSKAITFSANFIYAIVRRMEEWRGEGLALECRTRPRGSYNSRLIQPRL